MHAGSIGSCNKDVVGVAVDNDLMTPSFKLKRPQLQKHYQKQIDQMYKDAKKGM